MNVPESRAARMVRAIAARKAVADKLETMADELEELACELHHAFPRASSRCDWAAEHVRHAVDNLNGTAGRG